MRRIIMNIYTTVFMGRRMNLTNIAEHRIKLLFKKSEGKATESDLKHADRLKRLMQKTNADSVTLEEDKSFLEYAKWTIAALESKTTQSAN
jgi:inhibitor of KinA sporulation pathway (predicted exonuclease)